MHRLGEIHPMKQCNNYKNDFFRRNRVVGAMSIFLTITLSVENIAILNTSLLGTPTQFLESLKISELRSHTIKKFDRIFLLKC